MGNESVSGHTKPKGPAPVQVGGVDCSEHPLIPISLEHPVLMAQEHGLLFGQWPPLRLTTVAFHICLCSLSTSSLSGTKHFGMMVGTSFLLFLHSAEVELNAG